MSDFFYDGQIKRYLTQFMRIMSSFSYKDAKGQLVRIPVRYGDMNRQVASIMKKNTENTIPSAPFIACYIKDVKFDRPRLQDPTFVSKVNIRERAFDADGNEYMNTQGANYTVERIMPTPYVITFAADIWTTNTDQKLQIFEQLAVLFTPSLELQTTDNYIDWTSLSVLEMSDQGAFSSRQIPQGAEQDIDIMNMIFTSPIWITPPAKVKKLGIITKIISNIFVVPTGTVASLEGGYGDAIFGEPDAKMVITPGNFELLVLDNTAKLVGPEVHDGIVNIGDVENNTSWLRILDLYPGQFRAGLSQLRLSKDDGSEIVAYISLDPTDESRMMLNFDNDTRPSDTVIAGRSTIDAIINPETFNPQGVVAGTRYLTLENINEFHAQPGYDGPVAWKNSDSTDFVAHANDIIEWDGVAWHVVFDSLASTSIVYITNSYTNVQYKWNQGSWSKSFEGIYSKTLWRLIL
jgi:hypothetical protein